MKQWFKDNIMSSLSLAGIVAFIYLVAQKEDRIFTTEKMRYDTEEFIETVDPVKAYGEYIIDSIEEVNTQAWR